MQQALQTVLLSSKGLIGAAQLDIPGHRAATMLMDTAHQAELRQESVSVPPTQIAPVAPTAHVASDPVVATVATVATVGPVAPGPWPASPLSAAPAQQSRPGGIGKWLWQGLALGIASFGLAAGALVLLKNPEPSKGIVEGSAAPAVDLEAVQQQVAPAALPLAPSPVTIAAPPDALPAPSAPPASAPVVAPSPPAAKAAPGGSAKPRPAAAAPARNPAEFALPPEPPASAPLPAKSADKAGERPAEKAAEPSPSGPKGAPAKPVQDKAIEKPVPLD